MRISLSQALDDTPIEREYEFRRPNHEKGMEPRTFLMGWWRTITTRCGLPARVIWLRNESDLVRMPTIRRRKLPSNLVLQRKLSLIRKKKKEKMGTTRVPKELKPLGIFLLLILYFSLS